MDIQYYKDAKHNYLILEADVNDENLYQYRMLENNRIDGLLPFSLRNMDECYYLYYEIDSRQSIRNRYDRKKIPYEKLVNFLSDLVETAKNLEDYLLDVSHLLLSPDTVYEDFSTGKFYFIYDPVHEKTIDQSFFENLMQFVDMEDNRSSKFIMKLTESICDERGLDFCILDKALKSDIKGYTTEEKPVVETSRGIYETGISMNENRNSTERYMDDYDDDEDAEAADSSEISEKKVKIKLPVGRNFLMSALFATIAGILWYLRYAYILTYEENILDIAVFIICVMMSLSCFIMQLRKNDKVFGRKKKSADIEKMETETAREAINNETVAAVRTNMPAPIDFSEIMDEDEEGNEETVLLGFDFSSKSHKLYAQEDTNLENIGLYNLPIVVGKLASCADAVIRDKSVSRMHAKIFRMDKSRDTLWIQDLGSTNGTFVNGRKLMPNEKVELFENDEVSFGKCVYAYR
ncbi:DUF6382 domain-containing protein [Butyrivibrio sp. VCD2006]|uniref:DUF6382 domain-containing protein n=1 Tax=Butyrivibrio sp. VCD2006 TaxID=1280664 RepID=UPI00047C4383|nr:DUF6382 domain-containing protein [Butyrivibrio sp. VCD2006]